MVVRAAVGAGRPLPRRPVPGRPAPGRAVLGRSRFAPHAARPSGRDGCVRRRFDHTCTDLVGRRTGRVGVGAVADGHRGGGVGGLVRALSGRPWDPTTARQSSSVRMAREAGSPPAAPAAGRNGGWSRVPAADYRRDGAEVEPGRVGCERCPGCAVSAGGGTRARGQWRSGALDPAAGSDALADVLGGGLGRLAGWCGCVEPGPRGEVARGSCQTIWLPAGCVGAATGAPAHPHHACCSGADPVGDRLDGLPRPRHPASVGSGHESVVGNARERESTFQVVHGDGAVVHDGDRSGGSGGGGGGGNRDVEVAPC